MKLFIAVLAGLVFLLSTAQAQTRNMYGYVFGLGTATGAILDIQIIDNGTVYHADGWKWSALAPAGLRWWKNGLPANRSYIVRVFSNGLGYRDVAFWMPSGWGDFKAPDIHF